MLLIRSSSALIAFLVFRLILHAVIQSAANREREQKAVLAAVIPSPLAISARLGRASGFALTLGELGTLDEVDESKAIDAVRQAGRLSSTPSARLKWMCHWVRQVGHHQKISTLMLGRTPVLAGIFPGRVQRHSPARALELENDAASRATCLKQALGLAGLLGRKAPARRTR